MGLDVIFHPNSDIGTGGIQSGKIVLRGPAQNVPQAGKRFLPYRGVQQKIRPLGDGPDIVALGRMQKQKDDLAVQVAQIFGDVPSHRLISAYILPSAASVSSPRLLRISFSSWLSALFPQENTVWFIGLSGECLPWKNSSSSVGCAWRSNSAVTSAARQ